MDSCDIDVYRGVWRPSKSPTVAVPLGTRSVGHATFRKGWRHPAGTIRWFNVYWMVCGTLALRVNGRVLRMDAQQVAIHPAGASIEGLPCDSDGAYRWLTIDGPLAGPTLKSFGLAILRPMSAGRCPVELFDQLERQMKDSSAMGEYRSATMACEILSLAAWGRRCEPSVNRLQQLVDACLRTIQDRYTWPDLTVDWLARTLKVHRSVLSRAFSKSVGVPISRYIQSMRIRRALSLLNDATQTIAEVAHASGFADPAYFSRCLSKEMGCSPRKIRKSLS